MSKLKPCPFCVGDAEMHFDRLGGKTIYMVKCSVETCQCQEMGWHDTEQKAIDVWNSRPVEDALQSRIAEMEKRAFSIYELFGKHDSGDSAEYYLDNLDIDIRELLCKSERQQARIAELEKSAVVWHKYPDEKPEKSETSDGLAWVPYLASVTCGYNPQVEMVFWRDGAWYRCDGGYYAHNQILYWAGMPAPPEGER